MQAICHETMLPSPPQNEIGQTMVESFNAEARRRVANRTFFGSLTFLSVIARRDQ